MDEMDVPKDQVNATPRTCPCTYQTSQSTSRTSLVHCGGKQDSFKRFVFFFKLEKLSKQGNKITVRLLERVLISKSKDRDTQTFLVFQL